MVLGLSLGCVLGDHVQLQGRSYNVRIYAGAYTPSLPNMCPQQSETALFTHFHESAHTCAYNLGKTGYGPGLRYYINDTEWPASL